MTDIDPDLAAVLEQPDLTCTTPAEDFATFMAANRKTTAPLFTTTDTDD